jgi:Flp pilus assembly pilin Flp
MHMNRLTRLYLRLAQLYRTRDRGQTMTEYALILAAVAILVFAAYATMGNDINDLITWKTIDTWLTS